MYITFFLLDLHLLVHLLKIVATSETAVTNN